MSADKSKWISVKTPPTDGIVHTVLLCHEQQYLVAVAFYTPKSEWRAVFWVGRDTSAYRLIVEEPCNKVLLWMPGLPMEYRINDPFSAHELADIIEQIS